jgi:hypothetical protein
MEKARDFHTGPLVRVFRMSILQISKKSPLPWWERDRERGKVAEISHVTPFHPPPNPLPSREGGYYSTLLQEYRIITDIIFYCP